LDGRRPSSPSRPISWNRSASLPGFHAPQEERELGVLERREDGEEVVGLEDEADVLQAESGELGAAQLGEVPARDPDPAARGRGEATDEVEERGLPRAGRTRHGHELAGLDLQREITHRLHGLRLLLVDLPHALGADGGRRVGGRLG